MEPGGFAAGFRASCPLVCACARHSAQPRPRGRGAGRAGASGTDRDCTEALAHGNPSPSTVAPRQCGLRLGPGQPTPYGHRWKPAPGTHSGHLPPVYGPGRPHRPLQLQGAAALCNSRAQWRTRRAPAARGCRYGTSALGPIPVAIGGRQSPSLHWQCLFNDAGARPTGYQCNANSPQP